MKKKQAKITDGQEGPWSIIGGERGIYTQSMLKYKEFGEAMRRGAGRHGVDSYMGAALGMDLVKVSGGLRGDMMGAFMGAGGRDEELHSVMKNSWGKVEESAENNMFKDGDLAHVVSAVRHAERSSLDLVEGSGNAAVAAADIATLNAKVFRYREGKSRSSLRLSANEENVAKAYLNDPTLDQVKALQAVIDKKMDSDLGGQWGTRARYLIGKGIDDVGARRVLRYIGDRQSLEVMKATEKLVADPTNIHNMRAVRAAAAAAQETDRFTSGVGASQGSELTPPSPADPKAKWVAKYRKGMLPAARELRR
ncbi:hypothetical protein DFR68_113114 [Nocardia mexicana]|uniref:Uncharacterized protein n=2 Tax=Nocardia mexicana TaxID=279262 RepID=A0A370GTU2_9NOCA|nr:hypothetical protein DFR68_113114 [Nocardia mexicana]